MPTLPETQAAEDLRFMQFALALAAETAGLASPNPQVGCVLVKKGKVIGKGAHIYQDFDHAEIVALKHAADRGLNSRGSTAYVTLEPCSHHGRTGPCADALIAAGITRAVVAIEDPNPAVSGRGLQKLRDAGIEVTLGVCRQQARELNDAFAHFIRSRRPFVTLKAALSADGKLAPAPVHRLPNQPFWLTGEAARHEVQVLRHRSDAILTGIGTVLADDPALTDRSHLSGTGGIPRRPLLRVILDTHLRIPLTSSLVRSAEQDLLLLCGPRARTSTIDALEQKGAEVQIVPEHAGRLSLSAVLDLLAQRSCISLLLECGSHLNASFLSQHLVDKLVLFYAPRTLGSDAIPFATGLPSSQTFEQQLTGSTRNDLGPDTVVTGYLHNPWPIP